MQSRIEYGKVAPGVMTAMNGLGRYLAECRLEPSLQELVKTWASQINGCAYCQPGQVNQAILHFLAA